VSVTPAPTTAVPIDEASAAVLVGAGDIAACDDGGRAALTGRLAASIAPTTATVFTTGDNAYPSGRIQDFEDCYAAAWGALRARTRPATGNHEWQTSGAAGYHAYFGDAAGPPDATWYAYDAGTWRVIVLDSECDHVGGCDAGSPQGRWLAAELAKQTAGCSVAIWHRPRFSSGDRHGSDPSVAPLFEAVAAGGVDLVLNGHEHSYERFGRLSPNGRPDLDGVREIVVGTGGAEAYGFDAPLAGSEFRVTGVPAILVLQLAPGAYRWRLVGGEDARTLDEGSDRCRP
jgi:alkaline phosphatase